MFRVLVADSIAEEGVRFLQSKAQVDVRLRLGLKKLLEAIGEYDALVVRSETQVTADVLAAGTRLQVVGRAGVGVDNIDLDEATRRGILVVNAPTGNTVAAAEHTVALLMALARNIPQAHLSLKGGEWKRSQFTGVEVRGKTLGIVGLGKVGTEVARRALALQMRVVTHDPYVSPDYLKRLGVEPFSLQELLKVSDFISVHTPLTDDTTSLIGDKELALVKPTARIINVARGGIVNEEALLRALDEGRVAAAALDVFSQEPPQDNPLLAHPRVIVTPHLGASTAEAQANVALEVAEEVLAALEGRPARNAVNAPFVLPEAGSVLAPYVSLAMALGKLQSQLVDGQLVSIILRCEGEIAEKDGKVLKPLFLTGLLQPVSSERVTLVNAGLIAAQRGIKSTEERSDTAERYSSLLTTEVVTTSGRTLLSATAVRDEGHLVRVNDYWIDMHLEEGYMLFVDHHDRPGMIGMVGTITGKNDINISFMEVGRLTARGQATMILGLDDVVPEAVLAQIRAIPGVSRAKVVKL